MPARWWKADAVGEKEFMSDNRSTTPPAGAGTFSATDLRRRMAEREAAKAAEEMRHMKEQEEKQKEVMAEFHKPPERTPEQVMQGVMQLVSRAAEGSTTRSPGGKRRWRAGPKRLTNSGTITCGHWASTSRPRCSSIPAACP